MACSLPCTLGTPTSDYRNNHWKREYPMRANRERWRALVIIPGFVLIISGLSVGKRPDGTGMTRPLARAGLLSPPPRMFLPLALTGDEPVGQISGHVTTEDTGE